MAFYMFACRAQKPRQHRLNYNKSDLVLSTSIDQDYVDDLSRICIQIDQDTI